MADPLTIGLGAAGLFVAGMTAVANISSAYSQYRANHPRKTKTGRVDNYTARHEGYSMMQQQQVYPELDPYFAALMYMMVSSQSQPQPYPQLQPQPSPQPQPHLHQAYQTQTHQHWIPGHPSPSYPIHQQPPPTKSSSFSEQHFPAYCRLMNRLLGRTSTVSEVHAGVPQHVLRWNSAPTHHTPFDYQVPGRASQHGHAGWITLSTEQQSRDTLPDTNLGMHTGRMPGYNLGMAQTHWYQFLCRSTNVAEGTIAVVNWSERSIAMYVYSEWWRQYFLNYTVCHFDLEAFANVYARYQVFTGILQDSWLMGCNDDLKVVEDDRCCGVKSNNCWSLLGIQGHIPGELLFVEMKRAALFGLIQCRSKDPSLLNVDMVGDAKIQFVHVDTQYRNLETKGDCWFSVFSFKTNGWAEQRVLVG